MATSQQLVLGAHTAPIKCVEWLPQRGVLATAGAHRAMCVSIILLHTQWEGSAQDCLRQRLPQRGVLVSAGVHWGHLGGGLFLHTQRVPWPLRHKKSHAGRTHCPHTHNTQAGTTQCGCGTPACRHPAAASRAWSCRGSHTLCPRAAASWWWALQIATC